MDRNFIRPRHFAPYRGRTPQECVDRNDGYGHGFALVCSVALHRSAWIEIVAKWESGEVMPRRTPQECVDRNLGLPHGVLSGLNVALRKECVDRNR